MFCNVFYSAISNVSRKLDPIIRKTKKKNILQIKKKIISKFALKMRCFKCQRKQNNKLK